LNPVNALLASATSMDEILAVIARLHKPRPLATFGVTKREGVSLQRERRQANDLAIELLQSLPQNFDGNRLTDDQRQILARYSGEGGLKGKEGSQYEYYTPQFMAEGIWDLFANYGINGGHMLEPSAGTGIFQETKLPGAIITSAELSPLSGRINQLLHPEDDVRVGAFEDLASNVPDNTYDHAVGNVPFGEGRSGVASRDPAYAKEMNVGNYFVLRTIDKVKPGGLVILVVPNGMTDGTKSKKLRDKVSRRAEFLGAHRMPSGTFSESGTDTVVDVWVLRKHPSEFEDILRDSTDAQLAGANVLWSTFIKGKWFLTTEGRRFVHGEMERTNYQNMLVVKSDGRVTNAAMKTALSRRFDSRIDWDSLGVVTPAWQGAKEGDLRIVGGIWHKFDGVRWVIDAESFSLHVDEARYGAKTQSELHAKIGSTQGILSLTLEQIAAIANDYPSLIPDDMASLLRFVLKQRKKDRERIWRGSIVGLKINRAMDLRSLGQEFTDVMADAAQLTASEIDRYGKPGDVKLKDLSEAGSRHWLTFAGNVTTDGSTSALLNGQIDVSDGAAGIDFSKPDQVVAHLFSDVALVPVSLAEFRATFAGELPADDDALLNWLATFPEIAIDGFGNILPMGRAASGDIKSKVSALVALLESATGEQKANFERQLALINEKREFTPLDKVTVNMNARWLDRRLIKEFLAEQGYDEFKYTEPEMQIVDGVLVSADDYDGKDGVFTGYQMRTVSGKNGNEFKKANNKDGFLNQLENYLNGVKPRGVNANEYLDKIAALETSFNDWLRTHPNAESIANDYNDAFNGYIPFSHSSAPLGLTGISGKRIPLSYQNEEVRRLSEDGRGIMGFGTGLGKTTTALALEAYNFETGRTKRTCIAVPKAVYQNWYHEAQGFYSQEAFAGMLFVGLDEVMNEGGEISTAPVLDENGEPRLDSAGIAILRNVVKESSSATVIQRMNMIPTSNYRTVIMTKEQFASIPLRDETIEENSQQAVFNAVDMGRLDLASGRHRDAAKKNRIKDQAADTGTTKKRNVPYFEDMRFDSVIADEGHNYRNSFGAGREAGQLAYLPNPSVSQMARDMAVKSAYMMQKNNGRGVVMLTATPLVNSPIDAFNMLSTVVPQSEWIRMGILTPDDFVRVFGKTETVQVQKLSGEVEEKQGLVGFQNLNGLRGIFHRWTTLKNAADVGETVKIPDLEENTLSIPMTDEQAEIYETLRKRAQELSSPVKTVVINDENGVPQEYHSIKDPNEKPDDFIFSIIRDMDKVAIDPDLYASAITFQFPSDQSVRAKGIFDGLPSIAGGRLSDDEDEAVEGLVDTRTSKVVKTEFFDRTTHVEIRASIELEPEILKAIKAAGIHPETVSHPIPPKYAALIDNLREGLKSGKQIIFIDEKAQHEKLRRIISSALQIDPAEIGIINATTVQKAGGVKLKAVKLPTEPKPNKDGEFKDGAWEEYYTKKAQYDDYVAAKTDTSLEGMEGIAADFNEGRTRIIICNKKAEVGINLHIGTTDVHHLTLPWTPASIDQRNGRGARVGSPQEKVRVHYYCGKGTFDDFRLETLKRKKDWIKSVMTSDISEISNGDVEDADERASMLAENPEARRAIMERQTEERRQRIAEKALRDANNALDSFLKAANAANQDLEMLSLELQSATERLEKDQAYHDKMVASGTTRNGLKISLEGLSRGKKRVRELKGTLARAKTAGTTMKRARGDVERAITNGVLDIDIDVVQNPQSYIRVPSGVMLRIGSYFRVLTDGADLPYAGVVQVKKIYPERGEFDCKLMWKDADSRYSSRNAGSSLTLDFGSVLEPVVFEKDAAEARMKAAIGVPSFELSLELTREQFVDAITIGQMLVKGKAASSYYGYQEKVNYWVYRDALGKLHLSFCGDGKIGNTIGNSGNKEILPEQWVYPDRNDESLKRELVARMNSDEPFSENDAAGFLRAVFGYDYEKGMEAYGNQASYDDVVTIVDNWMASRDLDGRSLDKLSSEDVISVYRKPAGDGLKSFWEGIMGVRGFRGESKAFANKSEMERMFYQVRDARINDKISRAQTGAKELGAKMFAQYKKLTEDQGKAMLPAMLVDSAANAYKVVNETLNPLETDATMWINAGKVIHAYEDKDIGVDNFSSTASLLILVNMAFNQLAKLKAGGYKDLLSEELTGASWDEYLGIFMGDLTSESVKVRLQEARALRQDSAEVQAEVTKEADADYTIEINTTAIIGRVNVRRRWFSINEPEGQVYLIADNPGSSVIYRAKNVIKNQFNGRFWNFEANPIADVEFDRPAWVVSTHYKIDEIRAAIARG